MTKLLVSGVPGTGKTTLANYLEVGYGFFHVDMEADEFTHRKEFSRDPTAFLGMLTAHKDVVLSWGFRPFKDRPAVEKLIEAGFSVIWLDGDRVASFRNFMARENNNPMNEATYYEQLYAILITRIAETLALRPINPYTSTGDFRQTEEIASEILDGTILLQR